MTNRSFEVDIENALPIIWCVKQDAKFNHLMITLLKSSIETGRLELLIDSNEARDLIEDRGLKLTEHQILDMIAPNIETDLLIKELTALEISMQANGIYLKVDNPNMRKDRFSSIGFSMVYSNILEQQLTKRKKKKKSFNISYTPQDYFNN